MRARANVVLPAPRSPDNVTMSPGLSAFATSTASRRVAISAGRTTEKLAPPAGAIMAPPDRSCGRPLGELAEREDAGHRGAGADRRFERHGAAMQLHERAHQRQAEPG